MNQSKRKVRYGEVRVSEGERWRERERLNIILYKSDEKYKLYQVKLLTEIDKNH